MQEAYNIESQIKTCTKCKIEKPVDMFRKEKTGRFGVVSQCKVCKKILDKEYRDANIEKCRAYNKDWIEANPEKNRIAAQKYAKANREKVNIRMKEWRHNNLETRKAKINVYLANKYRTDKKFKLNLNVTNAIRGSLKYGKNGRHWEDIVGYTLKDLMNHIEKQFTGSMSWKRFLVGEIHIDHKIPIAVFNFTNPEHLDFKQCWALSNLQPMWASENLSKGAKINIPFQPSLLISGEQDARGMANIGNF